MTTCYANPRAEEGKRGEGEWTGKTVSTGTVCLCAHWQEGLCACRFVYVSACVVIVCLSCVLVEKCPVVYSTATGWE